MTTSSTAIIDYKMGNIWSLKNALDNLKIKYQLVSDPEKINDFSHIILPGVGSAREAYNRLEKSGFVESIKEAVLEKERKILGICVGMQLMGSSTEEDGGSKGIGFFKNKVLKLKENVGIKLPHVGFNNVQTNESVLFDGLKQKDFYFVHSYHIKTYDESNILNESEYDYKFVSAIEKDNIFGVQYHPEKSHDAGSQLLKNFTKL